MGKSVIMHALMSLMLQGAYEDTTTPTTITTTPSGCYDGYGCFPTDGVWSSPQRPVSLHPLPPTNVTPIYCLYTPSSPYCHVLDMEDSSTFTSSSLDPAASLYILTHGYLESTQLEWVQQMVEALLNTSNGDVGVVTVDWYRAAPPTYAQAVANIRLVGVMVGQLLGVMVDMGVSASNIHLIGHSLGAHLMSYAGNTLTSIRGVQVGRLSGLDPAGPYFTNTSIEVRLDPSDAVFVDVIHTDSPSHPWQLNRLGSGEVMGHVDFYPNGGEQQAGCEGSAASHIKKKDTVAGGVLSYLGCSHQRSLHYFIHSIKYPRCFIGVECSSWEAYTAGECWRSDDDDNDNKVYLAMGFPATQPSLYKAEEGDNTSFYTPERKIYLGTNPDAPYCAEQYRVRVVVSQGYEGDLARFTVTLRAHLATLTLPAPPSAAWIEGGVMSLWVGWGTGDLGKVYSLQVEYEEDQNILQALIWRFKPPTLHVKEFVVEALSLGTMIRFPYCGGMMQSGHSYTLYPHTDCQH